MGKVTIKNGGTITSPDKGEIRNPKGRGKGHLNRATIARRWLDIMTKVTNPETKEVEQATVEDKVMLALIQKAMKGDAKAIELVFEMKYGKMMQPVGLDQSINHRIEIGIVHCELPLNYSEADVVKLIEEEKK